MKRKEAAFAVSTLRFCESGRINNTVLRASGSISLSLSQPIKPQRVLSNLARLPLLTVPDKQEEVLEMTGAEALIDFSEMTEAGIGEKLAETWTSYRETLHRM